MTTSPVYVGSMSVEVFNADDAREALRKLAPGQRKSRPSNIARFRSDMVEGRWTMAPDLITFDTSGNLLNGQHRLAALVEADKAKPGITVSFPVWRNAPVGTIAVADQGMKRSLTDMMRIEFGDALKGVSLAHFAAAVRKAYLIDNGMRLEGQNLITNRMLVDYLRANFEGLKASCAIGQSVAKSTNYGINGSLVSAMYFVMSRDTNPDLVNQFFDDVRSGMARFKGDPANMLYMRFLRLAGTSTWNSGQGLNMQAILLIKAWEAWLMNTSVGVLKVGRAETRGSWVEPYNMFVLATVGEKVD